MNIFDYLSGFESYIVNKDWHGLESCYEAIARSLAGNVEAEEIKVLDFSKYAERLLVGSRESLARAADSVIKAIYFEYDLDNQWQSFFFLCKSYNPPECGTEDWASDFDQYISGPSFPELTSIYQREGFDKSEKAKGTTLFLVARTVSAFGRVVQTLGPCDKPICMAFHDQDPILRIAETRKSCGTLSV